jgi:hypothetical protein
VQKHLDNQSILLALAVVRLPGVPLIFAHNSQMTEATQNNDHMTTAELSAAGVFGGDWEGVTCKKSSSSWGAFWEVVKLALRGLVYFCLCIDGPTVNLIPMRTALHCTVLCAVVIFFTVHMWLGGIVFCQCFTVATNLFVNPAEKTVGATVMNVLYYTGVCVSSIVLLLI